MQNAASDLGVHGLHKCVKDVLNPLTGRTPTFYFPLAAVETCLLQGVQAECWAPNRTRNPRRFHTHVLGSLKKNELETSSKKS